LTAPLCAFTIAIGAILRRDRFACRNLAGKYFASAAPLNVYQRYKRLLGLNNFVCLP
jgi:hypothetical protein